jgi:PhnB protein
MNAENKHIRNRIGAVRPFIFGRLDLLDFVKRVFGAIELERNKIDNGFHVQAQIGDSVIILSAMEPPYAEATLASVYVYVDDIDATYERAIAAGAISLAIPSERPFQERTASVKDSFGNIWYLATYTGSPLSKVKWRFAADRDLPLLAELNHQLINNEGADNPMSQIQLQDRMGGWLASQYQAVLFDVASENVGYALLRVDEDGVYLRQFFICRATRRRGYGRQAVELLLREVVPKGRSVTVEVLDHKESALAFWRAVGFVHHARTLKLVH